MISALKIKQSFLELKEKQFNFFNDTSYSMNNIRFIGFCSIALGSIFTCYGILYDSECKKGDRETFEQWSMGILNTI